MLHAPFLAGEGASSSPIRLRAISLGAGVQSTTMALLAAHGEIGPMPDCAIFADTGWEPKAVYEHLEWLMSGNVLPFPVHIVSAFDHTQTALSLGAVGYLVKPVKREELVQALQSLTAQLARTVRRVRRSLARTPIAARRRTSSR